MHKPDPDELQDAMSYAAHLRLNDEDAHHVAKTLLYIDYRNKLLEEVLANTRNFLQSGLSAHEHTLLLKSIELLDEEFRDPEDSAAFGLD
jgi:hypothetical protein